jgi:aminopeptidase
MSDRRLTGLAELIVKYSTAVQPGDKVIIWGFPLEPIAAPLVREIYTQVLAAGGNPISYIDLEGLNYIHYKYANEKQLAYVHPVVRMVYETFDVAIGINASSNAFALSDIPQPRLSQVAKAHAEVVQTFLRRSASGELRWMTTYFPTNSLAQQMEMSLPELENFYYRCTFADTGDPIGSWQAFAAGQAANAEKLSGKRSVQLKGPDVDLAFSIAGRHITSDSGQCNLPDGEIETSPVENSVNGWIRFNYPTVYRGRTVSGVELLFKDGRVEQATAETGEEFLLATLNTDPGAKYVGEFAIGTNEMVDRFTKNILFDEKMAGTIHIALGAGYPESGSQNKSAIHWDMVCDMRDSGQIVVDDELIYESGKFLS